MNNRLILFFVALATTMKYVKHSSYYLYAERNFYESTTINMNHYVCYTCFSAVFVVSYMVLDRRAEKGKVDRKLSEGKRDSE